MFHLQARCGALPPTQQPAVLASFSVPEPLLPGARGRLDAYAAAAAARCGGGGAWTDAELTSAEQASHAVVL